jgi:Lrp/AsnC family leucine-responsive transcriptional regulator
MNRKSYPPPTIVSQAFVPDATDLQLLELLQNDGRMSWAELGRQVSMTAPAVRERVAKLEAEGIIRGFHASIAADHLGHGIVAYIRVATDSHARLNALVERLEAIPQVVEAHTVTGEDSCMAKVLAASTDELDHITSSLNRYGRTATSIVLSTPLDRRAFVPS